MFIDSEIVEIYSFQMQRGSSKAKFSQLIRELLEPACCAQKKGIENKVKEKHISISLADVIL